MRLSRDELRLQRRGEKAGERRGLLAALGLSLAILLLFLCFRYNAYAYEDKFCPLEYGRSYLLWLRLSFARIFDLPLWYRKEAEISAVGGSLSYYGALSQLKLALMTFVSGAAVALSGAIFQTAYRNPMASPNIIGASAGVGLGNVAVVMLASAAAYDNILLRYEYCYGFSALCIALVLLLGRLSGAKRESFPVLSMILAGSVVSQLINVITMYLMYNLEEDDLVIYQELSLGTYVDTGRISLCVFLAVMAISVLPVLLLRFRMNALGMDRATAASAGVSAPPLRAVGQLCGAIMATCSMIHCGQVGMLSLTVPYIVRRRLGSDFRFLAVYSGIFGGCIMLVCRLVTSFFSLAGEPLPVNFIIQLLMLPVFAVMAAGRRRDTDAA